MLSRFDEQGLCRHITTIQDFQQVSTPDSRWDICQATFSLQNLRTEDRRSTLRWLAERCRTLLLVEFDVPKCITEGEEGERLSAVLSAYSKGVAEYMALGEGGLKVLDGFLVPVMLGYFDNASATNFEQPISNWEDELYEAGFDSVHSTQVFPYWWAECCLVHATSSSSSTKVD